MKSSRMRWEITDASRRPPAKRGLPPTEGLNCGEKRGRQHFEVNQKSGWALERQQSVFAP